MFEAFAGFSFLRRCRYNVNALMIVVGLCLQPGAHALLLSGLIIQEYLILLLLTEALWSHVPLLKSCNSKSNITDDLMELVPSLFGSYILVAITITMI